MGAGGGEFGDERVAGTGVDHDAAAEIEPAFEGPGQDHVARRVDGQRRLALLAAVAEAPTPEMDAGGPELRDEDVAAPGAGQSAAAEIDRTAEAARNDGVARGIDRDGAAPPGNRCCRRSARSRGARREWGFRAEGPELSSLQPRARQAMARRIAEGPPSCGSTCRSLFPRRVRAVMAPVNRPRSGMIFPCHSRRRRRGGTVRGTYHAGAGTVHACGPGSVSGRRRACAGATHRSKLGCTDCGRCSGAALPGGAGAS